MVLTGKVYAANEEPELEEEEEEPKDPRDELKEKCLTKSCSNYQLRLEECNDRVNSRTNTAETCTEELFDLFHCVDHCVAPNLFKHLK